MIPELKQRIDKEADDYAAGKHARFYETGYIAGATVWAERAEKLREALEVCKEALEYSYDVLSYPATGKTKQDEAIRIAETTLEQYKKETA